MTLDTLTPTSPDDMLVRIDVADLARVVTVAHKLGLIPSKIYAAPDGEGLDIACRRMGVKGNHGPEWTERERLAFIRRMND